MILVTGGTGQLGTALRSLLPDAWFPGRDVVDLARPDAAVAAVADAAPDAIVNCAAYTAVDRAEDEEALATTVNATAVGALAGYAARSGIPFVTLSTDYVFDGTATQPYVESSPTWPLNAYGRSKRDGEVAALEAHPGALVVRTSWVFSATHDNFVAAMVRRAARGEALAVTDQRGSPTSATDLAGGLLAALEAGAAGVLHLVNAGDPSRFELAVAAVTLAGLDPAAVRPTDAASFSTEARRPAYSALRSERLEALALEPLPHWREALPSVVANLVAG